MSNWVRFHRVLLPAAALLSAAALGAAGCVPRAVPAEVEPDAAVLAVESAAAPRESAARDAEAAASPARFPSEFQLTSMQGTAYRPHVPGNTREGIDAALEQGIRFVEVDLRLTRDGELVTTHGRGLNECGILREISAQQARDCRLAEGRSLATLADVLERRFLSIYLDLKDTSATDEATVLEAITAAADAVVRTGRRRDVVLMTYAAPAHAVQLIRSRGLRAGLKGYPKRVDETDAMVRQAAELGFELVSVNADAVSEESILAAAKRGVWMLPWSLKPAHPTQWRDLAAAGVGGLIVMRWQHAEGTAVPAWRDVRTLLEES